VSDGLFGKLYTHRLPLGALFKRQPGQPLVNQLAERVAQASNSRPDSSLCSHNRAAAAALAISDQNPSSASWIAFTSGRFLCSFPSVVCVQLVLPKPALQGGERLTCEWLIPDLGSVYSFGRYTDGELYILAGTRVYRIDPAP
jgi:hypothetical protein